MLVDWVSGLVNLWWFKLNLGQTKRVLSAVFCIKRRNEGKEVGC
jgi:hypothetical protein